MRTLYLHIGLPKTATSTLQKYLYENKDALMNNNLIYTETGMNHELKCHHDLIWAFGLHEGVPNLTKENIQLKKNELIKKLESDSIRYKDFDIIISSELIYFLEDFKKLKEIVDIFKMHNLKIIFTIRKQKEFLLSLYQQIVKDGLSETFYEWFQKNKDFANYKLLLEKIETIISLDNVIVNLYNKDDNPVESFFKKLNIDISINNLNLNQDIENKALSYDCIEMIRLSNKLKLGISHILVEKCLENKNDYFNKLNVDNIDNLIYDYYNDANVIFAQMLSSKKILDYLRGF